MKKTIYFLSVSLLALCLLGCSEDEAVKNMEDREFKHTETCTYTPRNSSVEAVKYLEDYSSYLRKTFDNNIKTDYGLTAIQPATNKYNCHSYAWHSQSTKNPLWIPKPDMYWQDGSYNYNLTSNTKTIPSGVHAGDIVVWFKDGEAKHSAIVKDPKNNIVLSKWGPSGLYEHTLQNSPYNDCPTVKYYSFSGMYDTSDPYPYPKYRQYYTY